MIVARFKERIVEVSDDIQLRIEDLETMMMDDSNDYDSLKQEREHLDDAANELMMACDHIGTSRYKKKVFI